MTQWSLTSHNSRRVSPTASPSPPKPPAAPPQPLPGSSSTRSSDGPTRAEEGGSRAAEQTFSKKPSLGLNTAPPDHGVIDDQRRLSGAYLIAIHRIRPDATQPRQQLSAEGLGELTRSIQELGILQPVTVRLLPGEEGYQLISGERRYRAAQAAGLAEIPCWVQTPAEEEILLRQVVENWQRAELHPFDLADSLVRLRDAHGLTQKKIAERTGKPESEVSRLLSLLKLHPEVQKEARADLSETIGIRLLVAVSHLPQEEQPRMLRKVREQGLTTTQAETLVRDQRDQSRQTPRCGAPAAHHVRLVTPSAVIVLTFQKKHVALPDVLNALLVATDQVRTQMESVSAPEQ